MPIPRFNDSTIPTLLGTLFSTLSILSWKTSPDTFSLKGRRSHRYLPQGVLKVVRKLHSLSRETCQYPDLALSKLKYFESANSGKMSSTVLLYHWFLFIARLRSFGSRHSRKEPSGFFNWNNRVNPLSVLPYFFNDSKLCQSLQFCFVEGF